jgi:calcineurin-like phosphoesterase family protein
VKVQLKKGQKIWFTSDSHYNHGNICKATSKWDNKSKTRDFESLEKMNGFLVDAINERVAEDDYLFHLGDFAFGGIEAVRDFRQQINCKNLHLILGNHDHRIKEDVDLIQDEFSSVHEYLLLTVKKGDLDQRFVLCHYPIASWYGLCHGVIHLHGHLHLPPHLRMHNNMSMDVGVEGNNFKPISMELIVSLMKDKDPCAHTVLPEKY